jgi:hypothetical protein
MKESGLNSLMERNKVRTKDERMECNRILARSGKALSLIKTNWKFKRNVLVFSLIIRARTSLRSSSQFSIPPSEMVLRALYM